MYWLPFLERLVQDGIPRERLIPISRGGAAAWYGCPKGLEVYGMRPVEDVRVEMRLRVASAKESLKQLRWTPFERQLVKDAAETLGLTSYQTLHPRWMYHVLSNYWEAQKGLAWLQKRVVWSTIPAPALPPLTMDLPEPFVAVRFYQRPTFTDRAKGFAEAVVAQISRDVPVVILHNDTFVDDHQDLKLQGRNVYHLRDLVPEVPVASNLAIQTAVLAKAAAFVGTYGGFAQLALRMGKPSVSFVEEWQGTMLVHKHLAETVGIVTGVPFLVTGIPDIPLLQGALPILRTREEKSVPAVNLRVANSA
jgi:hypothetical protein